VITIESPEQLAGWVGTEVAVSDWVEVTQARVDRFAEATGDHQWIHVDPERANAGPFGTTIAHGFLTLSMLPMLMEATLDLRRCRMGINYGVNRVRFPAPVPVGSRLRARMALLGCEPLPDRGVQATWRVTIEREGGDKPVCVAESLSRWYF